MRPEEWALVRGHVIRWSECDIYAHVNHAAYLTLFEDLRVEHWRMLSGHAVAPDRAGPVVARLEVRYIRPVGFGEEVVLTCRTAALRRNSFTHEYALWRDGEICCDARAVCVVTRQDTGAKVALTDAMRARMLAEGAREE
jgi:acyl-CoA thioester hydrolase